MDSFAKLYETIETNPYRDHTIDLRSSQTQLRREQYETWDVFYQKPLNPPGSLSQFLLNTDSLYQAASPILRKQIMNEKLLEIQERIDTELVGRRWPRKKIQDALANQFNSYTYSELVEEALCELYQFQKIILHRKTKKISFYPTDLRLWKSDRPVYLGDDEGCWAYEPIQPLHFLQWLTQKEDEEWKVEWPTAEGKMEEIKSEVLKRNLVAHTLPGSDTKKVKKDDWARTLGRAQAIETLARNPMNIQ